MGIMYGLVDQSTHLLKMRKVRDPGTDAGDGGGRKDGGAGGRGEGGGEEKREGEGLGAGEGDRVGEV